MALKIFDRCACVNHMLFFLNRNFGFVLYFILFEMGTIINDIKDPDIIELDDDSKVLKPHTAFSHPDIRELQKEIAKVMRRIQKNPNVISTLFINNWGLPEETTMKIMIATLTSRVVRPFIWRCEFVIRDLDPDDVLIAVRLTTLKSEILMTTDFDFILVVFHKLMPDPILYPKAPKNKEY